MSEAKFESEPISEICLLGVDHNYISVLVHLFAMDQIEEASLRKEIGVIAAIEYTLRTEKDKARLNALEAEILRRHPEYKGTSFTTEINLYYYLQ